jgi:colicin import membrane protein
MIMKKVVTLLLVMCFTVMTSQVFGQQNTKQKDDKTKKTEVKAKDSENQKDTLKIKDGQKPPKKEGDELKEGETPPPVKEGDKADQGKGNAYGKDKQGLEGKEFGQARRDSTQDKNAQKKGAKSSKKKSHKRK